MATSHVASEPACTSPSRVSVWFEDHLAKTYVTKRWKMVHCRATTRTREMLPIANHITNVMIATMAIIHLASEPAYTSPCSVEV